MGSDDDSELRAGDFSPWLAGMQAAIRGEQEADVPCAGCTACCTSSQFVHIGPDETDTLAHVPAELLFPAPRRPRGHVLLGYDERGHCPMLVNDQCSIYEHRPQTCRTYDCRILPAAGVTVDGDQAAIGQRARRWRFEFPTADDRVRHDAVRTGREVRSRAPRRASRPRSARERDPASGAGGRAARAVHRARRTRSVDGRGSQSDAVSAELRRPAG